jgi:hypothetical protein
MLSSSAILAEDETRGESNPTITKSAGPEILRDTEQQAIPVTIPVKLMSEELHQRHRWRMIQCKSTMSNSS